MFTLGFYRLLVLTSFRVLLAEQISIEFSKSSITVQQTIIVTGTPSPIVTPSPVVRTLPPTDKLACDLNPCFNGATCTNLVPRDTNYKCDCTYGWTGVNCATATSGFTASTEIQYIKVGNLTISSQSSINIKTLLQDNSTDLFKESCEVFKENLNKTMAASDRSISLLNLRCLAFSFSSFYYVSYVMEFPADNNVTINRITEAIENGIIALNNSDKSISSAEIVFNSSKITDLDECKESLGYCQSSASCINLPGGYTCQCPSGYEMLYNGECNETKGDSSNVLVIVLPTIFGGLLLFLVLMCVFIAVRRQKFRYELAIHQQPP